MNSVDCQLFDVPVPRPGYTSREPRLFWPDGRTQLVVLFVTRDDNVVALGIASNASDGPKQVFRAEITVEEKKWLIDSVAEGREPDRPPVDAAGNTDLSGVDPHAIVITDTDGEGKGPKCCLPPPPPA